MSVTLVGVFFVATCPAHPLATSTWGSAFDGRAALRYANVHNLSFHERSTFHRMMRA